MKNVWSGITMLFLGCTLMTAGASAEEVDKFEASVGLGVIVINSGNNLNTKGSNEYLTDLDSAAGKESYVIPLIMPNATYDIGKKGGLKLYLDTKPPIDEVGGFAINIGGNYLYEGIGTLDVNAFFTPFEEAWENPYAVGVSRTTTSTAKYGAKVAFNRILGTGLRVNFVYMNDDVDTDVIGDLIPELGRDGEVYALNANYSFFPSKKLEIRPRAGVRKGYYDGDSNSFTKYKIDLEARYRRGKLMIMPRIFYSSSEYDEVNPIFNKIREDDGYGVSVKGNYIAPFNWEDWSVQGLINYSKGESNITFYDTEGISVGLFMSYQF